MSPTKTTPPAKKPTVTIPKTEVSTAEAKQNRQYLIIMVVITGALVIVGGFIIFRLFKAYLHRTNEIKATDKYIASLKQKQQDLNSLRPNYEQITQKGSNNLSTADFIYRALPKHAEFKSLIGLIENIGAAAGVGVNITSSGNAGSAAGSGNQSSSSSPNTTTTLGGVTDTDFKGSEAVPFEFSVTITAPYDQVINFMKITEQSLRPLNFKAINVSATSGTIQAQITFDTFYQGLADIDNKQEPLK